MLEKAVMTNPISVILREKDLPEDEYYILAGKALEICGKYNVPCILHTFADTAVKLDCRSIHLPLPLLRELPPDKKKFFDIIGTSCHSVEDAIEAQSLGVSYITAGHVFATDCKKGLPPRGIQFLEKVCKAVTVPVYAIGGISPERMPQVIEAGASGGCMMSYYFK